MLSNPTFTGPDVAFATNATCRKYMPGSARLASAENFGVVVHALGPEKWTAPTAVFGPGSGGKPVSGPITEMNSHPDVKPLEISTSSRTTPVYGTEPPTWNDCIQYPRAPELGRPIWR